jgi:hypothetical protein
MPWMQGAIADYPVLRHDGSATSYRSYLWAMPGADFGLVLLVNANNCADESQLNRVAHNVQRILFGVEPGPLSGEPDTLKRWGKHLFALVAVAQLTLAAASVRALRRTRRGEPLRPTGWAVLVTASVVDLVALASLLWLIPAATVSPLPVVAQAPDARILVTIMGLGVAWGAIRSVLWVGAIRRSRATTVLDPA